MEECQKEMHMSKKARSRKKAPAIGPRIVRAWFDTVVNPLLNGLEKEQQLLAQHNWTWEFSPPSLELGFYQFTQPLIPLSRLYGAPWDFFGSFAARSL